MKFLKIAKNKKRYFFSMLIEYCAYMNINSFYASFSTGAYSVGGLFKTSLHHRK